MTWAIHMPYYLSCPDKPNHELFYRLPLRQMSSFMNHSATMVWLRDIRTQPYITFIALLCVAALRGRRIYASSKYRIPTEHGARVRQVFILGPVPGHAHKEPHQEEEERLVHIEGKPEIFSSQSMITTQHLFFFRKSSHQCTSSSSFWFSFWPYLSRFIPKLMSRRWVHW